MENMDDKEIQYIFNDSLNVLGLTQDVKFRDFFISFMDRYNSCNEVRDKYEELTRVEDNVYEERRIKDDNLDDYKIEELKTIRDKIDARIIELRNEEKVNERFNDTFIDMEIRKNESVNKRKRIYKSRKARAKYMSKEELKEKAQRMRTVDQNFKPLDEEMDHYVHKNGVLVFNFDDYGVLILLDTIDKDKYTTEVAKIKFKKNSINKTETGLYTNYYLNRPSSLKEIEKLINTIKN